MAARTAVTRLRVGTRIGVAKSYYEITITKDQQRPPSLVSSLLPVSCPCIMVQSYYMSTPRPRLVGQPLLCAIFVFASLGVFLASPSSFMMAGCTLTLSSLDMTKGMSLRARNHVYLIVASVMGGIQTAEPHFLGCFNHPKAIDLGAMVAMLEVGPFRVCASLPCTVVFAPEESFRSSQRDSGQ
jgi:hypothetical protein